MPLVAELADYSSSLRKVAQRALSSRNRWKEKCQKRKQANKLLGNQVRAVEHSRDHWRQLATDRQRRIAKLEAEANKNR